ncbi:MAG: glycoside hydrolase family 88 protein [Lachnospiraceae bacterium]|nr:glycoside hydrolase family 88 protein [Lachnospiraceae bacterium]
MFILSAEEVKWAEEIWQKLDGKLQVVTKRSCDKFPFWSENGLHDDMKDENINCWTNGFWSGINWLMYVGTGKEAYKKTALEGEKLLDKALSRPEMISHDVGFIWMLAARPDWRLTGNHQSWQRLKVAASYLMGRFNPEGGYVRAWDWGKDNMEKVGWTIIDTMMNLPLLYWASEDCGDPRYKFVAMKHTDMVMRDHIRPDGSVYHIVVHDPFTGEAVEKRGLQGYAAESSWSRGQSWAIYGFTLGYLHTGEQEYLATAKKVAHYFIAAVCEDWLPKSDFRSPKEPVYFDSSAGLCAACGMLELAKIVPEYEKRLYVHAAMKLLMNIEKNFADWSTDTDFIIGNSSGWYSKEQNVNIIYADYFFTEAVYKLKNFEPLFW